ncbi:gamma-glutamyltransferase [Alsobacter sp. R-9]
MRDFMKPGRSAAMAGRGMAATSHPDATLAAIDVLRAGGNAVDAALAAVALQGVIDPHMTGIGGDCFALVARPGHPVVAINGSGRTPAAASIEPLLAQGLATIPDGSAHAVTVPGAVDAWCLLSERLGRIGMDRILAPAIAAAREGFVVTPRVAHDWAVYQGRLKAHAEAAAHFLPGGHPPAPGDRMSNPALAGTLARIAREGRSAFYEGQVAEELASLLAAKGGSHRADDFAGHRTQEVTPISARYRGYELFECPPNGQGLAALLIARILEGFDLAGETLGEADRIHLLAEASKAAYRQRDALVCDPDHHPVDVDGLLSEASINAMRAPISLDRVQQPSSDESPVHRDTVYVSVVDGEGMAVSLINSIFFAFGSGIYAPRSGVLLQNRGAGFRLDPSHPNAFAPGKRPMHTIIPAMLMKDGRPVLSYGVMGGQYQAVGHAHVLSRIVDCGDDPQQASDRPRTFAHDGVLTLEPTVDSAVAADLERRGHRIAMAKEPLGGCQAIWIDRARGVLVGGSDHRKDGIALGY